MASAGPPHHISPGLFATCANIRRVIGAVVVIAAAVDAVNGSLGLIPPWLSYIGVLLVAIFWTTAEVLLRLRPLRLRLQSRAVTVAKLDPETRIWALAMILFLLLPRLVVAVTGQGVQPKPSSLGESSSLVQRIGFPYEDSPLNHGWHVVAGDEKDLMITHLDDPIMGAVIDFSSMNRAGLEYSLGADTRRQGRIVEFVAAFTPHSFIYVKVALVDVNGNAAVGWLRFAPDEAEPVEYLNEAEEGYAGEYFVGLAEHPASGKWSTLRIDVDSWVKQTFGQQEQRFRFVEMTDIRLRDPLSLAELRIFA